MCGINVPYAADTLRVDSSLRPPPGVTRQMRSVVDCWTYFNYKTSEAATIINNKWNSIEANLDAYAHLESETPDRQNELITQAFQANHLNNPNGYTTASWPTGGSSWSTPAGNGNWIQSIAGQVWPAFDLGDTSPEVSGVVEDKYYGYNSYEAVDDDLEIDRSEVDDTRSWGVTGGGAMLQRIHPSNIFDEPSMAISPNSPSSTALLETISRRGEKRIGLTGHLGTEYTDGSIDGDSWTGWAGQKLGISHFCLGGDLSGTGQNAYSIVKGLCWLPEGHDMADRPVGADATFGESNYSSPGLAYYGAKKSSVFQAFFGDFTSLGRPEIINWWINSAPGNTGKVFNWKYVEGYNYLTAAPDHPRYSGSGAARIQLSDGTYAKGMPSNLYALCGGRYSNGSSSNLSEAARQSYMRWFEWTGAIRHAIWNEQTGGGEDAAGPEANRNKQWSDGFIFGAEGPTANKEVFYEPKNSEYGPFPSNNSEGPIIDLRDKYYKVKQAFIGTADSVRTASRCILQLHLQLEEEKVNLNLTARSALADPAASASDKAAARAAINKLAENDDDFATGTRGFNTSLIFREQCFLMANLPTLARHSRNSSSEVGTRKSLPYGPYTGAPTTDGTDASGNSENSSNASICVDANSPFAFMNALSVGTTDAAFFDMSAKDISTLQPTICLYKVVFDEETRTEHSQKIIFDSFANTSKTIDFMGDVSSGTLLQNKQKRGFGVGIQSFDFKYAGSNPFAVKRSISATLKIFANGFDELLRERTSRILVDGGYHEKKYRYVDLALKTSNTGREADEDCSRQLINQENEEYAKLNFRLKAIVGWTYPEGNTDHLSSGVKDSLYNAFTTLNLTPTVHNFDFDDQGRVVFTINYLAYIDDFFDQDDYNVFISPEIYQAQEERRIQMAAFSCSTADAQATARENAIPEIDREKTESITTLISDLISKNKIYYIRRNYEDIRNFVATGPFFNPGDEAVVPLTSEDLNAGLETEIATALEGYTAANPSETMDAVRASLATTNPNSVNVPYFYLRDLCDIVLGRIGESLTQILLGAEAEAVDTAGARAISEADADVAAVDAQLAHAISPGSGFFLTGAEDSMLSDDAGFALDAIASGGYTLDYTPSPGATMAGIPDMTAQFYAAREPDLPSYPYFSDDDTLDATLGDDIATLVRTARSARMTRAELDDPELLAAAILRDRRRTLRSASAAASADCRSLAQYLKIMRLETEFKKFRMILGPVELFDPRDDTTSYTVNFGDVPVSVKYFTEFLADKLSSKEETVYPMANFFNDLMNGLVRNFLNDDTCFTSLNSSQKVTLNSASITGFNPGPTDEITDLIVDTYGITAPGRVNIDDLPVFSFDTVTGARPPIINVSGNSRLPDAGTIGLSDTEKNYMIFFAARTRPSPGQMTGNRRSDHMDGIYHYELGREKGIVKTIQLTKTETPGLQEVRFEQDGYDGLRQMRVVYDVNIETYANVHAYPGTYIFVNPRSFAPSSTLAPCNEFNLTEYGIGGYYMIITSEHSFGPGYANTKIYAKWVAEIGGDGPNCSDSAAGGGRINRCGS